MYHDLQCITYVFILGAGFVMTPTSGKYYNWEYVQTNKKGNGKNIYNTLNMKLWLYENLDGMRRWRFKLSQYLIPMWCARIIQNLKVGELKQIFHWRKSDCRATNKQDWVFHFRKCPNWPVNGCWSQRGLWVWYGGLNFCSILQLSWGQYGE